MKRFAIAVTLFLTACAGTRPCGPAEGYVAVNFTVWNSTDQPQPVTMDWDGQALYHGQIGTSDIFPKIVVHHDIDTVPGPHHITVSAPGLEQGTRDLLVDVGRNTNLHVTLRSTGVSITVTSGDEFYQ